MSKQHCLKIIVSCLLLTGCVASQPRNIANVCDIFEDRRGWYKAAKNSEDRWQIPIPVSMAFIYQESSFKARSKPPRRKILWIIPSSRPTSAYGYAQALDSTWQDYMLAVGNNGANRNNFNDAIDFIGWYNAMSRQINNIAAYDAGNLYLAYHEGNGGYARGSYLDKSWLLETANRVQENTDRFQSQYASCKSDLDKNWFFRIFS